MNHAHDHLDQLKAEVGDFEHPGGELVSWRITPGILRMRCRDMA
jgi:hypothetical protein